ncbi:hypothetical protein ACTFIY_002530 [Dictyostelium cf. discoideum]
MFIPKFRSNSIINLLKDINKSYLLKENSNNKNNSNNKKLITNKSNLNNCNNRNFISSSRVKINTQLTTSDIMMSYFKSFSPWRLSPSKLEMETAEKRILSNIKTPYEQKFVKVGDYEINTIKIGDKGEPLVLIHGFGAGIGLWCCNLDFLAKHYTVYAIDLLGFGRSSRPDPELIKSIDDAEKLWCDSIYEWSKELGLKKFNLVGHSLGGYVAATYSMKYPETLKHTLLLDCWGISVKPIDYEQNMTFSRRMLTKMLSIDISLSIVRKVGPKLVTRFRKDLLTKFQHVHPIEMADNSENIVSNYIYHSNSVEPATGEHLFRMVSLPFGWAANPLLPRIPLIDPSVDISFIYGEQSWIDSKPGFQLQKEMSNIKHVHLLKNSGHHVYADNIPDFHDYIIKSIPPIIEDNNKI